MRNITHIQNKSANCTSVKFPNICFVCVCVCGLENTHKMLYCLNLLLSLPLRPVCPKEIIFLSFSLSKNTINAIRKSICSEITCDDSPYNSDDNADVCCKVIFQPGRGYFWSGRVEFTFKFTNYDLNLKFSKIASKIE